MTAPDMLITCPREGCPYRVKDPERMKRHIERGHDDPERNRKREELLERRKDQP